MLISHCSLLMFHCPFLTTFYFSLLISHSILLTSQCSLLPTHLSLAHLNHFLQISHSSLTYYFAAVYSPQSIHIHTHCWTASNYSLECEKQAHKLKLQAFADKWLPMWIQSGNQDCLHASSSRFLFLTYESSLPTSHFWLLTAHFSLLAPASLIHTLNCSILTNSSLLTLHW